MPINNTGVEVLNGQVADQSDIIPLVEALDGADGIIALLNSIANNVTKMLNMDAVEDGGISLVKIDTSETSLESLVTSGLATLVTSTTSALGTLSMIASANTTLIAEKQDIVGSYAVQVADASVGSGTHTFDYALGDVQKVTATGDFTLAFANLPAGACVFNIIAVNWGDYNVTLPTLKNAIAPTFTAGGTDEVFFKKDNDGIFAVVTPLGA